MNIASLNLLLVEDHDFQRRLLHRMLGSLGALHITGVADGHAALQAFRDAERPFDICILDLNMPGMDGMELVRHLAEAHQEVSVILFSALERPLIAAVETMVKAYGVTLLGALEKPPTPAALQQVLEGYGKARPARPPSRWPAPSTDDLSAALEQGQFEPFFQPKADLRTGAIHSAEALARWRHPERGLVPPDSFIPLMESTGLIDQLTIQIVCKTATAQQRWAAQGMHYRVSINLSLSSLSHPGYAAQLSGMLEQNGVAPANIVFEVTESTAMADMSHCLENLTRLRMKGYALSIDDYGTGYASLQQLLRIPFSELKIDRAFVTSAGADHAQRLVLASTLKLARELQLASVAEGVESQSDWTLLRSLDCDLAQGYLIGKPSSASEFPGVVDAWHSKYSAMNWPQHP